MIAVNFSEFFFIILTLCMIYIFYLWFREVKRIKRNSWQLSSSQLFHCNNCHLSFVPKQAVSLCRCPRCNTVCIRRKNEVIVEKNISDESSSS